MEPLPNPQFKIPDYHYDHQEHDDRISTMAYWTASWLRHRMETDHWPITFETSQPVHPLIHFKIHTLHKPPDYIIWDLTIGFKTTKEDLMEVTQMISRTLIGLPPTPVILRPYPREGAKFAIKPFKGRLDDPIGLQTDTVRILLLNWFRQHKIANNWRIQIRTFIPPTEIWPTLLITHQRRQIVTLVHRITIRPSTTWRDVIKVQVQATQQEAVFNKSLRDNYNKLVQTLQTPKSISKIGRINLFKKSLAHEFGHLIALPNAKQIRACQPLVPIEALLKSK